MSEHQGFMFDTNAYGDVVAPSNGTPTSDEAAKLIEPHINELHEKILAYLRERGDYGATDQEMQAGIPMNENTQRPRRNELADFGLIRKNGLIRKTASGRSAEVWVLVKGAAK